MTATKVSTAPAGRRSIRERIEGLTGGVPFYPLAILFGLNAFDALDQNAFTVLLPNIRDYYGLDSQGILSVVALAAGAGLLLTVPIASLADRHSRVALMVIGAAALVVFSFGTGIAPVLWVFVVMRCCTASGLATSFPTHNSLLADYYPVPVRPRVYSFHAAAQAIGVALGVLLGAAFAATFDTWRAPFLIFAIPGVILIVLAMRLREPTRGRWEREAMGADASLLGIEDEPPSFAEAYRMVWKIQSLRRIFVALPFLAASIIGFASLASLQYEQTFHLSEVGRAFVMVPVQMVQLIGLIYGARLGVKRLAEGGPSKVFVLIAWAAVASSVLAAGFALAPWLGLAVVIQAMLTATLAVVGPGVLTSLSLGIPPRARAVGFSIGALFVLPGLVALPLVGAIGDAWGYHWGLLLMTPIFLIGGLAISRVGKVIDEDVHNVWVGTMARAEMMKERAEGNLELLSVRELGVAYGDVRVLFGVDLNVKEGEVIALLGTNGAGKSTLLKAISGVTEADRGAVVFDGRDITHAPPEEIAPLGIAQVPGGQGVFPSLTVAENLQAAGWMLRKDKKLRDKRVAEVLELFPVLQQRSEDHAADLSGGQQQMLTIGMAFMSRPRLLMIDELSLGLAPVVIEQLLDVVRAMRDQGTAIILVEQSVNVALTVADTAYFMEKGEIRFHGPTTELLDRPDVLRSVFLEGASKGLASEAVTANGYVVEPAPATGDPVGADSGNGSAVLPLVGGESSANGDGVGLDVVSVAGAEASTSAAMALSVRDVSVAFGGIRAVDDVTFDLAKGEVLGVIGPNGAGKTTLFDLITGLTKADSGRIRLGDEDITTLSAHRRAWRGLGRSFQDSHLFPSLTVEDTLMVALERWLDVRDPIDAAFRLPAFVDSETAARHRVDELIELMGIEAFRTKFVGELSTGSRRVVDLACVLAHEPSVVLLDEPSSGIAQREAEALGPLLLRIRESLEASLIVIEHDMGLVTSVSDRLVALDQGRVLASGSATDVLSHAGVVDSYLGGDLAVITRSGPRTDTTTEVHA